MLKLLSTYVISDLNVEKIVGTFYEKELLNTVKVELDLIRFMLFFNKSRFRKCNTS